MQQMQEYKPGPKTVVEVHFFTERTDGVSLQIKENARVLSSLGWRVIECSADATGEDGFVLPELDYTTPQVLALKVREKGGQHPEVEKPIAATVYTNLKDAFDAAVIGKKLADVLSIEANLYERSGK